MLRDVDAPDKLALRMIVFTLGSFTVANIGCLIPSLVRRPIG